jgi:hypothetical protein
VLALQRGAGNRAVARRLRPGPVTPKPVLQRATIQVPWFLGSYEIDTATMTREQLDAELLDLKDFMDHDVELNRFLEIANAMSAIEEAIAAGDFLTKRTRDDDADEPPTKRPRIEPAPSPDQPFIFDALDSAGLFDSPAALDIFGLWAPDDEPDTSAMRDDAPPPSVSSAQLLFGNAGPPPQPAQPQAQQPALPQAYGGPPPVHPAMPPGMHAAPPPQPAHPQIPQPAFPQIYGATPPVHHVMPPYMYGPPVAYLHPIPPIMYGFPGFQSQLPLGTPLQMPFSFQVPAKPKAAPPPSAKPKKKQPTKPKKAKQPKTAVGDEEEEGGADPKLAEADFQQAWPEKNPNTFYATLNKLLEANAKGDTTARQRLDELLARMAKSKHNRAYILKKIRVRAKQSAGAKFKSGLDEVFQTASTAEWIARSQGAPGVRPHSLYKHKPFDWVQAQQMVRVRTESIVWFVDQLLAGHSGAVAIRAGAWYTTGQKDFHEQRDDVQKKSTTPRNAAVRSLKLMLDLTANFTQWMDPQNQFQGLSAAGHDLTDAAARTLAWKTLAAYRDKLKHSYEEFFNNTSEDPALDRPATTTTTAAPKQGGFIDARTGQPQYWAPGSPVAYDPPSPRNDPTADYGQPQNFAGFGDLMQSSMEWQSSS